MQTDDTQLTPVQRRLLAEIRQAPDGCRYNGHSAKPLIALAEAGLILLRYEAARINGRGKDIYTAKAKP